jgi:hypothetical protein
MNTLQTLQVFNGGKPCGWLGQAPAGYWFHYSSNNAQQSWVSLLMPPTQNFYHHTELFPVFAQHAETLAGLAQLNGQQLGSLSFANPDNPVVVPPLQTPPALNPGQFALVSNPMRTATRRPFADTMVQHASCWPLVQTLQQLKKQADPNNRLQALRWAMQAEFTGDWVQHPRPDMDTYQQQLYGFEALFALLPGMDTKNETKLARVAQEVARTYSKNFVSENRLLQLALPFITNGQLQAHLVYQQRPARSQQPLVLGFEYIPA